MKQIIQNLVCRGRIALLAGALIIAGSTMAFSPFNHDSNQDSSKAPEVRLVVDQNPIQRDGKFTTSFAPVVKSVAPSVVQVYVSSKPKNVSPNLPFNDPFFRRFFGEDFDGQQLRKNMPAPKQHGLGSGVIVTKDGYILTNNHVVENSDDTKVALNDGREYKAKIIGTDPKTDIAVLKIDADNLPYLPLANSDKVEIGDVVLAIGNPFGIGQTVTMGIISATGRGNVGIDYEDFIQTDAAINPGNSGGALVDAEGRLIGINTAILSRTGGNHGIGFAIPVNLARNVMEGLMKDGRVVRGYIGVNIQDLNPALAKEFGVKERSGALVAEVSPDSPAEKAGLKSGDVIVEFNGKAVNDSRHLKLQVAQIKPGSKVPLKVMREGSQKNLSVTLKELPGSKVASNSNHDGGASSDTLNGVTVGEIDTLARSQLKLPANTKGALVTGVDESSPAFEAGLREGDVIQEINRQKVDTAEQAIQLSENLKEDKILLKVWSRGGSRFIVVDETKNSEKVG